MMNTTIKHLQTIAQPTLGGLAYWSVNCLAMFGNDCGSEIRSRVLGDSV